MSIKRFSDLNSETLDAAHGGLHMGGYRLAAFDLDAYAQEWLTSELAFGGYGVPTQYGALFPFGEAGAPGAPGTVYAAGPHASGGQAGQDGAPGASLFGGVGGQGGKGGAAY